MLGPCGCGLNSDIFFIPDGLERKRVALILSSDDGYGFFCFIRAHSRRACLWHPPPLFASGCACVRPECEPSPSRGPPRDPLGSPRARSPDGHPGAALTGPACSRVPCGRPMVACEAAAGALPPRSRCRRQWLVGGTWRRHAERTGAPGALGGPPRAIGRGWGGAGGSVATATGGRQRIPLS